MKTILFLSRTAKLLTQDIWKLTVLGGSCHFQGIQGFQLLPKYEKRTTTTNKTKQKTWQSNSSFRSGKKFITSPVKQLSFSQLISEMIKTKAKKGKKSRRNKKCISDHLLNQAILRFLYLPGLNIGFQSTRISTGFQRINIKLISFYMKKPERLKSFRINFLDLGNLSTFKTWAQVMQRHQRRGNSNVIT